MTTSFTFLFSLVMASGLTRVQSIGEEKLSFTINENLLAGHVVGNLRTGDHHVDYTYRLGVPSGLFKVDNKAKQLLTKTEIDAEAICEEAVDNNVHGSIDCNQSDGIVVSFDINIYDQVGSISKVLRVSIKIMDQNDEEPFFERDQLELNPKEILTMQGHKLDLMPAIDKDQSEPNRYLCYTLRNLKTLELYTEDEHFRLVVNDGLPRLEVLQTLDAESMDSVKLELLAFNCDQANDGTVCGAEFKKLTKPAKLLITINVEDMNDNQPFFETKEAQIEIAEDTRPPKMIYKMEAKDLDNKSHLEYSLVDKKREFANLFRINSNGSVELIGNLDYEKTKDYRLQIRVSDGSYKDQTTLLVKVTDVNDEKPTFRLNPAILSIPEHDIPGKVVGQVTIVDFDSKQVNGQVSCYEPKELRSNQPLEFSPDPQQNPFAGKFSLLSRRSFDRESLDGDTIKVVLLCKDGDDSSINTIRHTSSLTITLTITDVNDWDPEIVNGEGAEMEVHFAENNMVADMVTKITAKDRDIGDNGRINYKISDEKNFKIDSITGIITANRVFDREENSEYRFKLTATDQGEPKRSTTLNVLVKILDTNDNSPVILPCQSMNSKQNSLNPIYHMNEYRRYNSFSVGENQPPGTLVGHALAMDRDSGVNGELKYEFLGTNESEANMLFEIKPNGSIFTRTSLDRETKASYNLLIRVSDGSYETPRSSNGHVCVDVDDVNDNRPVFQINEPFLVQMDSILRVVDASEVQMNDEGGSYADRLAHATKRGQNNNKFIPLSMNEVVGYEVYRVVAIDDDIMENGKILYSLGRVHQRVDGFVDSQMSMELFHVDMETGSVRVKRKMRRNDLGKYLLNVTAQDMGRPPRFSFIGLLVRIEDAPARGGESFLAEGESKYFAEVPDVSWWHDSKNLLVVLMLGSISAILATILIIAVICLLRPCMKRYSSQCNLNDQDNLLTGYRMATQTNTLRERRNNSWLLNQDPYMAQSNVPMNSQFDQLEAPTNHPSLQSPRYISLIHPNLSIQTRQQESLAEACTDLSGQEAYRNLHMPTHIFTNGETFNHENNETKTNGN